MCEIKLWQMLKMWQIEKDVANVEIGMMKLLNDESPTSPTSPTYVANSPTQNLPEMG